MLNMRLTMNDGSDSNRVLVESINDSVAVSEPFANILVAGTQELCDLLEGTVRTCA